MAETIRTPAMAGKFYTASPQALRETVESYLEDADPPELSGVRGVISPHAGYVYSGPVAAYAYKLLSKQAEPPERIYLMGPSHRVWFSSVALGDYEAFRTPLGEVPVDRERVRELADSSELFEALNSPHTFEHSLEVQVPFLQVIYPSIPIVPMLFGEVDAVRVGQALEKYVQAGDLLIVSSDLSHYHDNATAHELDQAFLDKLLAGKISDVAQGEACGRAPAVTLMKIGAERHWSPHLLDYRTSGDISGDKRQVVGYAAVAYVEGS